MVAEEPALDPSFDLLLAPRDTQEGDCRAQLEAALEEQDREQAQRLFADRVPGRVRAIVVALVAVIFVASLFMGHYGLTPFESLNAIASFLGKAAAYLGACLADPSLLTEGSIPLTDEERVIWCVRLPRLVVVMLVGAALSVAGASYQGMFKNPLTSPDLLGASSGAALGACLGLLLNMSGAMVQVWAFVGGLAAVGCAVWLNRTVDYDPTLGLVLAGIMVSTLFDAGMSCVKLLADSNDKLPEITFWLMGSFHDINVGDLFVAVPMVVGFALLLRQSWKLNVLSFGDEEASAMGIDTKRTRLVVILAATLLTSASVSVAGMIGWIGLVVPHLARAVVGANYKVLMPASMLIGSGFLLVVDDIARMLLAVEMPIGIITAILGVPFFMVIFKRNMRGWR